MTTAAVGQLLYLLDEAFAGEDWHSLLGNLRAVAPEEWRWVRPGGDRSIRDIVQHVGGCKILYEDLGFGRAVLDWGQPFVEGVAEVLDDILGHVWLGGRRDSWRRGV